jgi:hypothetical protein
MATESYEEAIAELTKLLRYTVFSFLRRSNKAVLGPWFLFQ